MDLIHIHWTLTIRPWTVLYPSKGGPVLNVFLCYLRSPGHNRKTRTSSFGGVSSFPWFFTHPHTPPHTPTHTPTCPGIQSEDTLYTRVYSVFVPAFKSRTNLCITHSKSGHFFHTPLNVPGTYNFDLALSKCPHFECKIDSGLRFECWDERTPVFRYLQTHTYLCTLVVSLGVLYSSVSLR